MSYHNTNNEKGETLKESKKKAKSQDEMVYAYFKRHNQLGITPERCLRHFKIMEGLTESRWHNTPITSIRRSFSNLKKKGLIYKTGQTIEGDFGKQVAIWKAK
jgi:hypothetical protein